jgi:hypothetical protein
VNVSPPSETMLLALHLVAENGPIRPREFAKLMWPDRAGWRRVSNCGHGSTRGSGMHLAGGAYLGKLRRQGLVEPEFGAPRFLRGYILTALGRRVLETHGGGLGPVMYGTQLAPGEVVTRQAFGAWRYCYHNKLYLESGAGHGVLCNPVRYDDGRCVAHGGKQLVVFADGVVCAVVRRSLRLRARCGEHGLESGEREGQE